ncbi:MAG: hypothetical protein K9H64_00625 [Bacteroidales bacterium]|nr:hypothetical protein [Bacteroidales bacterium]MCF8457591.1 hypothetical protein [Bacteroidales bacterium]
MKNIFTLATFLLISFALSAQDQTNEYVNTAEKLLATEGKLTIGGYGEVHFNQAFGNDYRSNGDLDVHRMVTLFGYRFNERTQFITEIEYEHVKEVFVEQAFLQYKINSFLNFRAGLMLIPMGIINEYHEPVAFNGVERPLIDTYIVPSTWREIGFGFTGNILPASIKYQVYLMNGFNGYDGSAKLSASNGLRKGRQKGAESYISSPNLSAKIDFYGIKSLSLGLAGYFGKTQSSLYDGIDKDDKAAEAMADSSVIGISMIGLDARYNLKGLQLRGQYYLMNLSNSSEYNQFATSDLGSAMSGYYIEAGYNVFQTFNKHKSELIPFVRYENYNTHLKVEDGMVQDKAYNKTAITTGLTWKIASGAAFKADVQFLKSEAVDEYSRTLNMGIAVMF